MKRLARSLGRGLGFACAAAASLLGACAAPGPAVFRFEQSVVRVERDDAESPATTEEYQRQGFLTAAAGSAEAAAPLSLAEFVVAPESLAAAAKKEWTRAELADGDAAQRAPRTLEWGWPSSPTDVLFDPASLEPAVAGAPLPYSAIVLPGVLAAKTPVGGDGADGTVNVAWGAAIFPLRYRVVPDAARAGRGKVVLSPEPAVFQGRRQLLVLRAEGGWSVRGDAASRVPQESAGTISLRLLARKASGGTVTEGEVSSVKLEFRYVRLPAARFDAEKLVPGPERPADG